jgi:ABC-type transporter MlaC component
VAKNYRKNLVKVMEFEISYKGFKDTSGDTRVKTEAKNRLKPRDPAVQVDYIVTGAGGGYKTVDIYTENSSLAKNYYDQFHKMMITPGQGYPYIVTKLNEKIAKI